MKFIWNDIERPEFDSLEGDIKTDALIIGGGICGILCAYMLKMSGVDCVLVEADRICAGVTNGTTAKLTFQHGLIYDKIIKKYGEEMACLYYKSQNEALCKLTELAKETGAELEFCNSFVYSKNSRNAIEKETEALNKLGCRAEFCEETELPFSVSGAVKVENQAKFHPLEFAYAIAPKLKIFENTEVREIKAQTAITNHGKITADNIIVATHFPFINRHGGYFLKMYQHRSYVIALKNAHQIKDMYVDEDMRGLSFRRQKDLLLLGGGGHRTGTQGGNFSELRHVCKEYYPDAQETANWATQDCMTLDGVPYIGRYSKLTSNLYVATGFNKWGMTSSMVSATLLADMVCGRKNEYEELYSPSRSILHPQLAINAFESVKNLITPTAPRCPHMGCALKYNRAEHSWDCPCHGSRFGEDGKLLNNPATKDKEIKESDKR